MNEKFPSPNKINYSEKSTQSIEERFKESKVRAEDGSLLRVFHYSEASGIEDFSLEFVGKNYSGDKGFFGAGIYFTDQEQSFHYGAHQYAAHLNLKNPLILRNPTIEAVNELHGKRQELLDQGYDGVMVWNDAREGKESSSPGFKIKVNAKRAGWDEICVFKPEDIAVLNEPTNKLKQ